MAPAANLRGETQGSKTRSPDPGAPDASVDGRGWKPIGVYMKAFRRQSSSTFCPSLDTAKS